MIRAGVPTHSGRHTRRFVCACNLAAAGLAACAAPSAEQARPPLFERVDVPVGVHSLALVPASLNGDGHLDLLVVGGERVIGLAGRGDGRFDIVGSWPGGDNADDLAVADFDEDGLDDVAVANHDTDYLTILFGAPGGGFEHRAGSRMAAEVSPHPHAVRAADVDGDGHADLLVDDRDGEGIRLFPGRGDGGFGGSRLVPVGGDPYRAMDLADIDGDGRLDLVTPNPDHVAIVRGDGTGSFGPASTLRPGFAPFSVVAADFDGDGATDIAAGSGEGAGALVTWRRTADGAYEEMGRYALAAGPTTLAAADLTGDGRAEVIVSCYLGDEIAVLIGGDEPALHRLGSPGYPYGLATGDFDGDGRGDFAVAHDGAEHISVFLSRHSVTPDSD